MNSETSFNFLRSQRQINFVLRAIPTSSKQRNWHIQGVPFKTGQAIVLVKIDRSAKRISELTQGAKTFFQKTGQNKLVASPFIRLQVSHFLGDKELKLKISAY